MYNFNIFCKTCTNQEICPNCEESDSEEWEDCDDEDCEECEEVEVEDRGTQTSPVMDDGEDGGDSQELPGGRMV